MIGVCLRIKSMTFYFIPKIEWYFLLDNQKKNYYKPDIITKGEGYTLFFINQKKKNSWKEGHFIYYQFGAFQTYCIVMSLSNIRFWNICTFVLKQSSSSATFTASKFTPLLKDHTKFTNKAKTKSKLLTKSKVFSLFFLPRNHHKPYKQRSINKTKPHLLPSSTSSLSLSTQKTHRPLKQQYITTPPCPWMSIFSLCFFL